MSETFPSYFGKPNDSYSSLTEFGVNVVGDEYSYNEKNKVSSDKFMNAKLDFLFDSQQMAAFRSWHMHKIYNGNGWFIMELPEDNEEYLCRMIDGVFSVSLEEHKYFFCIIRY